MKQYKLVAWPDLPAPFHRMAYRRMLHQMSQRHVSLRQLARQSGLERSAVQRFIDTLAERELLLESEPVSVSLLGRFRSLLSPASH